MAAESKAKHIIFCGVHFMAESADILTRDEQKVILPNLRAGCSMADMANLEDVTTCWNSIIDKFNLFDPIHKDDPESPASDGESYLEVLFVHHLMPVASLNGRLKEQGKMEK